MFIENKETGEYSALVDCMLGSERNERMTVRLQADIFQESLRIHIEELVTL